MLETELIALGLTLREARLYLVLLGLGDAPASVLAKRSGLSRVSAYATLDQLFKRDLVTFYEKRGKRFYRVCPPQSFLQHCDDQIATIQAKRKRLEKLLPKLDSYHMGRDASVADSGRLVFIRDRVLFVNRAVNALKNAPEWYVLQDGSLWSLIVAIQQSAVQTPKCLLPISEQRKLSPHVRTIQAHYLPNAHLSGSVNVMVMGRTVMFIIEEGIEFFAVSIENREIACRLGTIFSFLWKTKFFDV